ncbi:unnamed protein product, partial [Meganyctiphanes norvegica]
ITNKWSYAYEILTHYFTVAYNASWKPCVIAFTAAFYCGLLLRPFTAACMPAGNRVISSLLRPVMVSSQQPVIASWKLLMRPVMFNAACNVYCGLYVYCGILMRPVMFNMANLEVVVPPEIMDQDSSGETEMEEGGSVRLLCKAKGYPKPEVQWRREKEKMISLRDGTPGGRRVKSFQGEVLELNHVKRADMGPYLCIAKNGIPPSVSKRIMLKVNFPPVLEVPVHMIGSPIGREVTIECRIESSPPSVNYWSKDPDTRDSMEREKGQMIIDSPKYTVMQRVENLYTVHMSLTIRNFSAGDEMSYRCQASNSLGTTESTVKVYGM